MKTLSSPGSDDITPVQELVYELRVNEIMKSDVITVSPYFSMRDLMALLREKRISGVPVVENGDLLGIISIEDLIKATAQQRFDDPVLDHMTQGIVTIRSDELAVKAVNLFAQHGYGRLPVIDQEGKLVGIVTSSDITRGLLKSLNQQFQSEELKRYRASHLFYDIISDQTSLMLRYHVAARDFDRGGQASSTVKKTLMRLGLNPVLLRRITVSSYEAEMNLIIHTTDGGELRLEIDPEKISLVAQDNGPGIEDVDEAFMPGFSTAPDWVRDLGFGAGMGLANIKRYSDSVSLVSEPGKGTVLCAAFDMKDGEES
ncbi:MAG TPA: CBS domain-containing protein [Deltaproteobacteria bacterium]|nr:CBS domain-containing protein [Deltaproteobacteria bacterium]